MDGTFAALMSTNETYYDLDRTKCLTTVLEELDEGKSPTDHNHDGVYSSVDHVHDTTVVTQSGTDLNNYTKAGLYSFANAYTPLNIPAGTNGWLFVLPWQKDSDTVKQFWFRHGTPGSTDQEVYTRMKTASTGWSSWRKISGDVQGTPLWTGAYLMTSNNTVTPAKPLSKCAKGWILVWSDYNPGEGAQNADFVTTIIPKKSFNGGTWSNHKFLCTVPQYSTIGSNIINVKTLYISDDKIVGDALNDQNERNDICLRAIYEF